MGPRGSSDGRGVETTAAGGVCRLLSGGFSFSFTRRRDLPFDQSIIEYGR